MKVFYVWKQLMNGKIEDVFTTDQWFNENLFSTRDAAIEWLKGQREKDENFGEGLCFVLSEMFIF